MKKIILNDLAVIDYDAKVLNVATCAYKDEQTWTCMGNPKKCHLLTFYRGMGAEYKGKSGKCFTAKDGDVVLTAEGSEYTVRFDKNNDDGCGMGINFYLYIDGEDLSFVDDMILFENGGAVMERLFCRAQENFYRSESPVLQKASLFRILAALGEGAAAKEESSVISVGVRYLRENFTEDLSLSCLADMCHISDVYFRRLFRQQFDMSPAEYRIRLRIERAKNYLAYTNDSISTIADMLGYSDGAFFIRQFKKECGMTPLAYRKRYGV